MDARIQSHLTDVVMPNRGGRAIADDIRRQRTEVRVLYISGYPDDTIAPRCAGPCDTLSAQGVYSRCIADRGQVGVERRRR